MTVPQRERGLDTACFAGMTISGAVASLGWGFDTAWLAMLPASLMIAMTAPEIIAVVLGRQWEGAAPALRILALAGVLQAFSALHVPVIRSLGARLPAAQLGFADGCFTLPTRNNRLTDDEGSRGVELRSWGPSDRFAIVVPDMLQQDANPVAFGTPVAPRRRAQGLDAAFPGTGLPARRRGGNSPGHGPARCIGTGTEP